MATITEISEKQKCSTQSNGDNSHLKVVSFNDSVQVKKGKAAIELLTTRMAIENMPDSVDKALCLRSWKGLLLEFMGQDTSYDAVVGGSSI